jgi:hypothetical protein
MHGSTVWAQSFCGAHRFHLHVEKCSAYHLFLLFSGLTYSSTLKMEVMCSSKLGVSYGFQIEKTMFLKFNYWRTRPYVRLQHNKICKKKKPVIVTCQSENHSKLKKKQGPCSSCSVSFSAIPTEFETWLTGSFFIVISTTNEPNQVQK